MLQRLLVGLFVTGTAAASLTSVACDHCGSIQEAGVRGGPRPSSAPSLEIPERVGSPWLVYGVGFDGEEPPPNRAERAEALMEQSLEVVSRRLEVAKISHSLSHEGMRLKVDLSSSPGFVNQAKRLLAVQGILEFRLADEEEQEIYEKLRVFAARDDRVTISKRQGKSFFTCHDHRAADGTKRTGAEITKGLIARAREAGVDLPEGREFFFKRLPAPRGDDAGDRWHSYLLHQDVVVSNADIEFVHAGYEEVGPDAGTPYVKLRLKAKGREALARVTGANVGKRMAVVIDGRVVGAPLIRVENSSGMAKVPMGFYGNMDALLARTRELVAVLRSGPLPLPLHGPL